MHKKKKTDKKEEVKLKEVNENDQRWLIKNGYCPDPICNTELGKSEEKTITSPSESFASQKVYKCTKCKKRWVFVGGSPRLLGT